MCNICNGHIHALNNKDIHDYLSVYLDPIILLLTFILGYYVSNRININKEIRELKRSLDFFIRYIPNLTKKISRQVDYLKKQIEDAKNLSDTRGLSITLINISINITESISKEKLFSAWDSIYKKDPSSLIEIFDNIELARKTIDRYQIDHTSFISRQADIRNQ